MWFSLRTGSGSGTRTKCRHFMKRNDIRWENKCTFVLDGSLPISIVHASTRSICSYLTLLCRFFSDKPSWSAIYMVQLAYIQRRQSETTNSKKKKHFEFNDATCELLQYKIERFEKVTKKYWLENESNAVWPQLVACSIVARLLLNRLHSFIWCVCVVGILFISGMFNWKTSTSERREWFGATLNMSTNRKTITSFDVN